ncbi:DoxX family protein [Myroides albus]|uniref:DoxX family membrane protein n=1 Tax=Myroides albus TaxID=2562892 RepID=A0A6I3LN56_9FLAO|nr:DoxX family protein [Myroides albus]MTG97425.1 DoxX family membrane protein [Myroides albus]UVD79454.1 DoxX family protein [Myroides albus]
MKQEIKVNPFSLLILRVALSGIFIVAGTSHIIAPDQVSKRIANANFGNFAHLFGDPYTLGIISGYAMILFGVLFLIGFMVRYVAAILFVILIPITITIQMGNGLLHGPLWKNIALFGGLLFFILNDFKSCSLISWNRFK